MADRVYPSAKPPAPANPAFPATKAQLYGATRPAYRPQPNRKRARRTCCLWTTVILLSLIFLVALAGLVLYLLYRPQRPSFDVSALKISSLNLTSSSLFIATMNLNITTRNPNKKLVYTYNPIAISVSTQQDDILIGTATLPSFVHGTKNTTLLKPSITSNGRALDDASAGKLRRDLKGKGGMGIKMKLDTKVRVKVGGVKSPKVGIRVACDGIKVTAPSGKTAATGSVANAKCKVDLRIKIWKWTL